MSESELRYAIEKFTKDLANKAESFVSDVTTLEVRTFSMPSTQISLLAGGELDLADQAMADKLRLRAYTKIDFDCDTTVCLPVDANDQIDRSVWDMHQSMVSQALQTRETMLRTMGDALASALEALQRIAG
ncbi:MAG: hypothetical protein MUF84_01070 [Anaerolineae bacterium]|jgi:hypothetical protein|nr:hypothetical protein [Anaerolineae bacterium]